MPVTAIAVLEDSHLLGKQADRRRGPLGVRSRDPRGPKRRRGGLSSRLPKARRTRRKGFPKFRFPTKTERASAAPAVKDRTGFPKDGPGNRDSPANPDGWLFPFPERGRTGFPR